jgi:capsular exopolysaccharide synthesis family protein
MALINVELPELPYAVEEALNRLRINIKFCGKNTKVILIVSSVPDEGKSFVSVQLWRMLAEAGFRSILVDTDLRKSVLKQRHNFSVEGELQGLDYYLSGQSEYDDIIYETNVKNGDIIPCSNTLENPATLFEDPRFKELFGKLSEEYRYVIVDAPPLVNVSDGALIASMCDGAILVVNSGETPKALVRQSMNQLERSDCKLLGVVLNKAEVANRSYYKHYGKYYGSYKQYYYGDSDSK